MLLSSVNAAWLVRYWILPATGLLPAAEALEAEVFAAGAGALAQRQRAMGTN